MNKEWLLKSLINYYIMSNSQEYQQGQLDQEKTFLEFIKNWNGSGNSLLGNLLIQKFEMLMCGIETPLQEPITFTDPLTVLNQLREYVKISEKTALEMGLLGYSYEQYQQMKREGIFEKSSNEAS